MVVQALRMVAGKDELHGLRGMEHFERLTPDQEAAIHSGVFGGTPQPRPPEAAKDP